MPSGRSVGREPTVDDLRWLRAGEDLQPQKSLARAADSARYVVTTVALLGTLVAGLGVLALDRQTGPLVATAGGVALVAAAAAVAVALTAVVSRTRSLAPEDVAAVRAWYSDELRRTGRAGLAGVLLVVSVVSAAVAGGAEVVQRVTAGPSVTLDSTTTVGGATLADVTTDADEGDRVDATLTCRGQVVARAKGLAGADGRVRLRMTAPGAGDGPCVVHADLYGSGSAAPARSVSLP